jgi:hypothetical protein
MNHTDSSSGFSYLSLLCGRMFHVQAMLAGMKLRSRPLASREWEDGDSHIS